jgi:hypothetical protein
MRVPGPRSIAALPAGDEERHRGRDADPRSHAANQGANRGRAGGALGTGPRWRGGLSGLGEEEEGEEDEAQRGPPQPAFPVRVGKPAIGWSWTDPLAGGFVMAELNRALASS